MITLYGFGAAFGLPDPSPFVVKAMVALQMAGRPYVLNNQGFRKAPRGKLPYIDDDGVIVSDSTLIRDHIARKYGVDFDAGLSAERRAVGWAAERMIEDHLYWIVVHDRWLDDDNFARGPKRFFDSAPAPLRPLICWMVRGRVRRDLRSQGAGRFTAAERHDLGERDLRALSAILGDQPFLLGDQPTGADATVYAFINSLLCPHFESRLRRTVEGIDNLVAYSRRMTERFFPAA